MEKRTAVLLGAGASADAKLPVSTKLTQVAMERLNATSFMPGDLPPWLRALNFVRGATIGALSQDGHDPDQDIGIERFIASLRILAHRADSEVAPFVADWKPGAHGFRSDLQYPNRHIQLERAVDQALDGNGVSSLESVISEIVQDELEEDYSESFVAAENQLVSVVQEILNNPGPVAYLAPLVELSNAQKTGLDVLNLNYDLTLETAAVKAGAYVHLGFHESTTGADLEFDLDSQNIRMYKVHGSIDWTKEHDPDGLNPVKIHASPLPLRWILPTTKDPWLVVGEREKLSTPGPILNLLQHATQALAEADRLLIIGYAFADDHINGLIRDWMFERNDRTITVLDFHPRYHLTGLRGAPTWFGKFVKRYGSSKNNLSRLRVLIGSTEKRLHEAISAEPREDYAAKATITRARQYGFSGIKVELQGADLVDVRLTLTLPLHRDERVETGNGSRPRDQLHPIVNGQVRTRAPYDVDSPLSTDVLTSAEPWMVAAYDLMEDDAKLILKGRRADSYAEQVKFDVDIAWDDIPS